MHDLAASTASARRRRTERAVLSRRGERAPSADAAPLPRPLEHRLGRTRASRCRPRSTWPPPTTSTGSTACAPLVEKGSCAEIWRTASRRSGAGCEAADGSRRAEGAAQPPRGANGRPSGHGALQGRRPRAHQEPEPDQPHAPAALRARQGGRDRPRPRRLHLRRRPRHDRPEGPHNCYAVRFEPRAVGRTRAP